MLLRGKRGDKEEKKISLGTQEQGSTNLSLNQMELDHSQTHSEVKMYAVA